MSLTCSVKSRPLSKKCPYTGCDYVSVAVTAQSNENNVSTHVSNMHRGTTKVWYGASQMTIHRDVKSNTFTCPCGEYSNVNAARVRAHAVRHKKKNVKGLSSVPRLSTAAALKRVEDGTYRAVDSNPKDKAHIGGREYRVATGPTVVNKNYPLVAMTPIGPPGETTSARAHPSTSASSSSKGASSSKFKSIASTTISRPVPAPFFSHAGPSAARNMSVKRKVEHPIAGPSKFRRVDNAPSVSSSKVIASSSKAEAQVSASTSTKRAADEEVPAAQPKDLVLGPSKFRRVDDASTVSSSDASSSKVKAGSESSPEKLSVSAPLKSKALIATPSAPTSGSRSVSTSTKRAADEELPERPSSKVPRVSGVRSVSELKAKLAKSPLKITPIPIKRPDRDIAVAQGKEKEVGPVGVPSTSTTTPSVANASSPVKGTPKPRPVFKPGTLQQSSSQGKTQTPSQKHFRPPPASGIDGSSVSSGFSSSTRGSSSSSSARTSATPAPGRSGSSKSPHCGACGGWLDAYNKSGMCTMCSVEPLPGPRAPAPKAEPRCVTCGKKRSGNEPSDECLKCRLKTPKLSRKDDSKKRATATTAAAFALSPLSTPAKPSTGALSSISHLRTSSPPPPDGDGPCLLSPLASPLRGLVPNPVLMPAPLNIAPPKLRKPRVTKQMRQRWFERWFASWKAAYRARNKAKSHSQVQHAAAGEEDKTDWWRVETTRSQGGVSYSTPEAFYEALREALKQHQLRVYGAGMTGAKKAKAKVDVLRFNGGYSIVAQPKISATARLDKLLAQMEDIGFRLDDAQMGYAKFKYTNGYAHGTMDDVYKFPCTCGGTPPGIAPNEVRHAHRVPDEKHAGEICGGMIMLMVGEDNALVAYGIRGQRIAVDIVH